MEENIARRMAYAKTRTCKTLDCDGARVSGPSIGSCMFGSIIDCTSQSNSAVHFHAQEIGLCSEQTINGAGCPNLRSDSAGEGVCGIVLK